MLVYSLIEMGDSIIPYFVNFFHLMRVFIVFYWENGIICITIQSQTSKRSVPYVFTFGRWAFNYPFGSRDCCRIFCSFRCCSSYRRCRRLTFRTSDCQFSFLQLQLYHKIRMSQRGLTVRNHNSGTPRHHSVQCLIYHFFCLLL